MMINCVLICQRFVFVTRPLPKDGGIAKDHGAPEAGQVSGPGPEVI